METAIHMTKEVNIELLETVLHQHCVLHPVVEVLEEGTRLHLKALDLEAIDGCQAFHASDWIHEVWQGMNLAVAGAR